MTRYPHTYAAISPGHLYGLKCEYTQALLNKEQSEGETHLKYRHEVKELAARLTAAGVTPPKTWEGAQREFGLSAEDQPSPLRRLAQRFFVLEMKWSAEASDYEKTLVIGNIQGFVSWVEGLATDGLTGAETAMIDAAWKRHEAAAPTTAEA